MAHDFSGKRVAVLGISVEGTDSARFFATHGAQVTCLDRRSPEQLTAVMHDLSPLGVSFNLGENYLTDVASYDMIVRSPGVSLTLPELKPVRESGRLTSQTKLMLALSPAPVIGVTGTKGKGTTSTLIAKMIEADGQKVWLGGNVGVPLLSSIDAISGDDWVVLELSSFQLEDCDRSPHIAVVLRITQDHLANFDTHASSFHATREDYVAAKRNIVAHQAASDTAIVNAADETSSSFVTSTPARILRFNRYEANGDAFVRDHAVFVRFEGESVKVAESATIQLKGEHNLENIAAASLASLAAGAQIDAVARAASSFTGLEHRLEFVAEKRGVSYYNDSFSTVPETTVAAIESFATPMVIVVGGSEKMSDFTDMGRAIAANPVKAVIVIGQMTERIVAALSSAGYAGQVVTGLTTMHDIVTRAAAVAVSGDTVILSPACASFDMFANYKERGRLFKDEVARL